MPALVDGREQLLRRLLAPAFRAFSGVRLPLSRASRVKMSAGGLIRPSSWKASICLAPSPSMSKASRETKCLQPLHRLRRTDQPAGAAPTASTSPVFAGPRAPHWSRRPDRSRETHRAWRPSGASPSTTPTICGITSPARCTIDPSRRRARPCARSRPRCAASRSAPRRRRPSPARASRPASARRCGRPGSSMPSRMVVACSAGNLCATAQRGARTTKPSRPAVEPVDLVDHAVDVVAERGAAPPRCRGRWRAAPRPTGRRRVSGLTGEAPALRTLRARRIASCAGSSAASPQA